MARCAFIALFILGLALTGWKLLAMGRFMADPAQSAGSYAPADPFAVRHYCASCYLAAEEVVRRDTHANPYQKTAVYQGVIATGSLKLDDPPHNPPPVFLVVRAVAHGLDDAHRFLGFRLRWFVLDVMFCVAALAFAGSALRREAPLFVALLPLVWASLPWQENLQVGQLQLPMAVLVLAGAVAIARGWQPAGGALIGAAAVAQLTPGLLLVPLAVGRRWRAVAGALAVGALALAISIAVQGLQVHLVYLRELSGFLATDQLQWTDPAKQRQMIPWKLSFWAMLMTLHFLGLPGSFGFAHVANRLFGIVVLGLAIQVGRRRGPRPVVVDVLGLLAIQGLALVQNPQAPRYTLAVPLLTLALLMAWTARGRLVGGRAVELVAQAALFLWLGFGLGRNDMDDLSTAQQVARVLSTCSLVAIALRALFPRAEPQPATTGRGG